MANDGTSAAQLLRRPYLSTVTEAEREYFLFLPKGYDDEPERRWPLVLFLHGGGERGDGLAELDKVLVHGPLHEAWTLGRDLPFLIIAPQMPPLDRDRERDMQARRAERRARVFPAIERAPRGVEPDWPEEGPPLGWHTYAADVMAMVDTTQRDYRVDVSRVYLTGLSYGGYGSFYFAAAEPSRWAAVVPVCGAANPDALGPIAAAATPIWIITGGKDTVVEPEWVLASAAGLEAAGHPEVRFTVHEDMGHDVWTRVYGGNDVYDWMLAQKRKE